MSNELLPSILTAVLAVFHFFLLIKGGKRHSKLWRWGLYLGMIAFGFTSFGFIRPHLNPQPWVTLTGGLAVIYGCGSIEFVKTHTLSTVQSVSFWKIFLWIISQRY